PTQPEPAHGRAVEGGLLYPELSSSLFCMKNETAKTHTFALMKNETAKTHTFALMKNETAKTHIFARSEHRKGKSPCSEGREGDSSFVSEKDK
ncbi:MAG: hypothetical protein PHS56_10865, partial [Eubacteriales bacterium]|nr:hypothetical protein [Eubacteriales bacterium]